MVNHVIYTPMLELHFFWFFKLNYLFCVKSNTYHINLGHNPLQYGQIFEVLLWNPNNEKKKYQ